MVGTIDMKDHEGQYNPLRIIVVQSDYVCHPARKPFLWLVMLAVLST